MLVDVDSHRLWIDGVADVLLVPLGLVCMLTATPGWMPRSCTTHNSQHDLMLPSPMHEKLGLVSASGREVARKREKSKTRRQTDLSLVVLLRRAGEQKLDTTQRVGLAQPVIFSAHAVAGVRETSEGDLLSFSRSFLSGTASIFSP
jgi:hypothetical protein